MDCDGCWLFGGDAGGGGNDGLVGETTPFCPRSPSPWPYTTEGRGEIPRCARNDIWAGLGVVVGWLVGWVGAAGGVYAVFCVMRGVCWLDLGSLRRRC